MSNTQELKISVPEGKKAVYDETTQTIKFVDIEPVFVYVDLGLPSGTKWATCNVGAKKETDFGDYLSFESSQKYNCPSKEQIYELEENTTSLWIVKDDVIGRLFIGKKGNYIFLPAAGYRLGESFDFECSRGYYWSSTPYPAYNSNAYDLYFDSNFVCPYNVNNCFLSLPVRPVSK